MKKPTDLLVRRGFLKKAGLGSVSIASALALPGILSTPTRAKAQFDDGSIINWIFAAFSKAATTTDGVAHRAAMEGHGFVDGGDIEGVGSYNLFDNASAVPKTILSAGTWEATGLNSLNLVGQWGAFESAIVDMQINLLQIIPSEAVIAARLVVPCNIPAAGLSTGEEEGFFLTIPGAAEGTYSPLSPPIGGSVFMLFEGGDD
jgi:hypothetical protein